MANMTVGDLATRARDILQDHSEVRWRPYELVWWINDAYSEMSQKRPDIFAESVEVQFDASAGVSRIDCSSPLFADYLGDVSRILDVSRIWRISCYFVAGRPAPTAGARWVDGHAIRQIDRSVLDDQHPYWRNTVVTPAATDPDSSTTVKYWCRDTGSPTVIWLYPGIRVNRVAIEMLVSKTPSGHPGDGLDQPLKVYSDAWAPVVLDYVLHRAYQKDAEYAANAERSVIHYNRVQEALKLNTPGEIEIFDTGIRPVDRPTMVQPNQPT